MDDSKPRAVVVIIGPTASGKSRLAMAVAERFGGTIINADSMQVYRELRVLTARPGPEDESAIPHRLYGVIPAAEACSAARWRALALAEIDDVLAGGRLPVVVGGTGLYVKALLEGLAPVPEIPQAVRAQLRQQLQVEGSAALHDVLAARDPETARRVRPSDPQRIVRALEVLEATGRPLVQWQSEAPEGSSPDLRFSVVALTPPKDLVYAACDRRFRAMLESGALEEVRELVGLGLDPELPAMKALGVSELAAHLRGDLSLEAAEERVCRATRRYAKRQLTWLRTQIVANWSGFEQDSETLELEIFAFIRENVLTP